MVSDHRHERYNPKESLKRFRHLLSEMLLIIILLIYTWINVRAKYFPDQATHRKILL